ncbi:DUF488 domain-containing protein [Tateyamaria sp. SN6-1]|uniref:DUF488 domain-containing protein n=1 Tax=Tateyamaria sp. SN6-1 TaxID=3092148 RepID=UPI0039F5FB70
MFQIKRIYDAPAQEDGYRVLVDRLWPRGVPTAAAKLDAWMKDIPPSPELRIWFGHDPERWLDFKHRYLAELTGPAQMACVAELKARGAGATVTLLYAANDDHHNHARILLDVLQS